MLRIFLTIAMACTLSCGAAFAVCWERDSLEQALSIHSLDPIEGIWQFPEDGATIGVIRASSSTYSIILLDSPRLDVKPGSEIGYAVTTATSSKYDAHMDSDKLANSKIKKAHAVIEVMDGSLRFKPYNSGTGVSVSKTASISLKRWIPYFFRVSLTNSSAPDGLSGAQRIYPIDRENYKPCL